MSRLRSKLQCSACDRVNYSWFRKANTPHEERLKLQKYCKWCQKHALHKETK